MQTTERCKRCKYHTYISSGDHSSRSLACYYIGVAGVPRGCPAGDECTKFEKGKMRKSQNWRFGK